MSEPYMCDHGIPGSRCDTCRADKAEAELARVKLERDMAVEFRTDPYTVHGATDGRPIGKIVNECGYVWNDNDESQQRSVLESVVRMVRYWRRLCGEATAGVGREKAYAHIARRCAALAKKVNGMRQSAMNYKRRQDFSRFVELEAERDDYKRQCDNFVAVLNDLAENKIPLVEAVRRIGELTAPPTNT